MAEYNKEKLYFLKLDKDFFNGYDIKIIEKSKNGKDSILFLLKLMCESTSHKGYLRYSEKRAYTNQELAFITDTDYKVVLNSMKLFKNNGIIEITKDKSIFIPKVAEMTISKTEGAELRQKQRLNKKRQSSDKVATTERQKGDKCRIDNKSIDNKIIDNKSIYIDSTSNYTINNKKEIILNKENENPFNQEKWDKMLDEVGGR